MPKMPEIKYPDPPPTIDQAAMQADANDRLKRRKGRASYVFGGSGGGAPTVVSGKTLTGQ